MIDVTQVKFRTDLIVTRMEGPKNDKGKPYIIENPSTGDCYEFGEEEYFLCHALDGHSTPDKIVERFKEEFDKTISINGFSEFLQNIEAMGLLENISLDEISEDDAQRSELSLKSNVSPNKASGSKAKRKKDTWCLFNPTHVFSLLVSVLSPFRLVFRFLILALFPSVVIAIYTLIDNQFILYQDIARFRTPFSYFGKLVFTLFLINFLRCIVQGMASTYFGMPVQEFGIRLRFGIIPRFYIDKSNIRKLDKHGKLWSYGSTILLRFIFIVIGIFVWFQFKNTGTFLANGGILVMQAGIIGLVIVSIPFPASDGYRWAVTFFNLPPSLLQQSLEILKRTIKRQPLPATISKGKKYRYLFYGLLLSVILIALFVKVSLSISAGLNRSFPGIWGRSTPFLFYAIVVFLIGRWLKSAHSKAKNKTQENGPGIELEMSNDRFAMKEASVRKGNWKRRVLQIIVFILVVVFLLYPFPYHRGGEIYLLPPQQQQIQTPVSGKIVGIFFNGGDGESIPAGTVIAKMASLDIENTVLTLEERISEQEANLKKTKANLDKITAGPRKEEVTEATARVEEAQKEIEIAKRQLKAVTVRSAYSDKELARIQSLHKENVLTIQDLEKATEQAEMDRIAIEEKQNNLAAKEKNLDKVEAQMDLLLKGASEEEIEVYRQEMEAARAELRRLKQELNYAKDQERNTELVMPFEGYLVESYLSRKMGNYLNQGEPYATAQDDSKLLVEMKLPEYDAGLIVEGATAEVKLLAYPNDPIEGKVLRIEPSTSEEVYGLVFNISIEITNPGLNLRPGMSGFGKIDIGEKPLILALTAPIIRFIKIEFWSWLP